MKRTLCSLILLFCLLASLSLPAFGSSTTLQTSASTRSNGQATRSVKTYTVSDKGIAFIKEMMGGSVSSSALEVAQKAVNQFILTYNLSLTQTQFDALADFIIAYDSKMLCSGYRVEKVIASGKYTDAELASAFCAWVKNGSTFSRARLDRRLREIKLFLYGSYTGVCEADFRYVIYYPNGGALTGNTVICYPFGKPFANLPTANKNGDYFGGWYTAAVGGEHLKNSHNANKNYTVYAHWSDEYVDDPNEIGDGSGGVTGGNTGGSVVTPDTTASESCIQMIKDYEGFVRYPMWDYGQYSIGYGTHCDPSDYPNGITEAEADLLLREVLAAETEPLVDKVMAASKISHTQNQYDALVSFTYNLGSQWINSSYKIYNYVVNGGCTEMEFVNAIGSWCSAGGTMLSNLVRRRMDEANVYLNGDYTVGSKTYVCMTFNPVTGTAESKYRYYKVGEPLGYLPDATRDGYHLVGWYDKIYGGTAYTEDTIAPAYGTLPLYARWEEGNGSGNNSGNNGNTGDNSGNNNNGNAGNGGNSGSNSGFTDVTEKDWFYDYVMDAVEQGLLRGVSDKEFAPNETMTRAMLVTVLHRVSGQEASDSTAPFTDVASGKWYTKAVNWAYEKGIVNGVTDTLFGCDHSITREQLTVMLYRFAKYKGINVSASAELDSFADSGNVSSYARKAIRWAVASEILSGDGAYLYPKANATRAQCAKMIVVFLDQLQG